MGLHVVGFDERVRLKGMAKGFFQACTLRQFRAFSRPTAVVEVGRRSGLLKVPNMA